MSQPQPVKEAHAAPPASRYFAFVVKGWSKEKLATRLAERLEPFLPEEILSITYAIDLHFFAPWRRNSALVVVRPAAED